MLAWAEALFGYNLQALAVLAVLAILTKKFFSSRSAPQKAFSLHSRANTNLNPVDDNCNPLESSHWI